VSGLRLLLQLIETLSLRLAPVDAAGEHDIPLSAAAQMQRNRAAASAASATSSGAGWQQMSASAGARNGTQHEETFLQLTLSAVTALVGHECCRAQLAYDRCTMELLQRIVRAAVLPETQAVAKRLIAALSMQPTAEVQPPSPAMRADRRQEQGGDATVQGLVDQDSEAADIRAPEHAASRAGTERGEWDPSDCEGGEDEVVDYHSDARSVSSYYSRTSRRSSTYSRGSSRSSRPGSMQSGSRRALSHEGEDDGELRSSANRSVHSSRASFLSEGEDDDERHSSANRSLHSSRASFLSDAESYADRSSCYTPLFSDASGTDTDDELDVEPPQREKLDKAKERRGVAVKACWRAGGGGCGPAHHGTAAVDETCDAGGDASTPHDHVHTSWKRIIGGGSSGHGSQTAEDVAWESGAQAGGADDAGAAVSQGDSTPSSVAQLIQKRELRLRIDPSPPAAGGGLAAIPASPMSGDGLAGLPPMLRHAMQERHHPDDAEVCASRLWKQKQRVVDAWLEVAQVLQMHKVALQELQFQRGVRLWRQTFVAWRRWLDADDEDDDDDEEEDEQDYQEDQGNPAHLTTEVQVLDASTSEPSSPTAHGPEHAINWNLMQGNVGNDSLSLREFNRSAFSLAERSRQSVCSEESFCGDSRSGPSLPSLSGRKYPKSAS
jgi:hypothetical protein